MKVSNHQSLSCFNTLAINAIAPKIIELESISDLSLVDDVDLKSSYVLGEGSNTLFVDTQTPVIIKPAFTGIKLNEYEDYTELEVNAGENWHQLVLSSIDKGLGGLENLALIPGSVGAAPVQNIGAYGVEFSDFCSYVMWFDFTTKQVVKISNRDCQFGYRDSIFKRSLKDKGLIVSVGLILSKQWQPKLAYAGLDDLDKTSSAKTIMDRVIEVRSAKLPNPSDLANAGSFFKNPVVDSSVLSELERKYDNVPNYPISDTEVKLAAAWLIDKSGLKGYRLGDAATHEKQALVIVNHGNASGKDIVDLASHIKTTVFQRFGVMLEHEVRFIATDGETSLAQLEREQTND